jgi:PAS domain-containing protein
LAIAASVGFRAMQITPLRNRDGELLGFGSLYFRHPRKFLERDARVSLHYARLATEMIEVRRAEIARTEDDLHIRRLVRGLNEYGLFMLDPAGRIVIWNEGARRVTGFDVDEIIGKHFSALFEPHQFELEKPGEAVRRAVADGASRISHCAREKTARRIGLTLSSPAE